MAEIVIVGAKRTSGPKHSLGIILIHNREQGKYQC